MDRLDHYRQVIKQILNEHSQYKPANGEVDKQTVFDNEHDRYQLMAVGWDKRGRVHGCVIHIDIKGDKIWLEHDGTDAVIAQQLVELGIPLRKILSSDFNLHTAENILVSQQAELEPRQTSE